ncbi:siderophore-interacting protein [Microbacterium sp. NPDC087591]|uniref:siderophore-interacting protein n=1 Tax=Microbacterium sp. NPDC087591 TaxID=3364192 RepID=UPI0038209581
MSTERPWAYSAFPVRVVSRKVLSPGFVRLTFAGDALENFATWGTDQRIKLVLPLPDGSLADFGLLEEPTPHPSDWYTRWKALPEGERNVLRTYTPAAIRPEQRELDVDFYLHEPAGPASAWAASAAPGDEVVITGPDRRMGWTGYGLHWAPGDARRFLLVADETAFPAVRSILQTLDATDVVDVILECQDPVNDIVSADAPALARIRVVARGDDDVPGAERAVSEWSAEHGAAVRDDPTFYAWIAGESGTTARVRRHITSAVGIPKERVSFLGYWKIGGPLVG